MAGSGALGRKRETDWRDRLRAEAIRSAHDDFDLLYHVSLAPAFPPGYDMPGIVAITFRLRERARGGHLFVTALDPAAAVRLGGRLGLAPEEALAMVDSHERMHVELQLAGVPEEVEEARSRFLDAVWLSLRHPRAEALVRTGAFGLVSEVGADFWERLLDPEAKAEAQRPR
ncbi:MAG TPA: hypothetical protein VM370_08840 [Candidatus Thermoplasmatota archaeon]|nr:hypothetical protein [Candidatus Thermoplasmatota archaeon]